MKEFVLHGVPAIFIIAIILTIIIGIVVSKHLSQTSPSAPVNPDAVWVCTQPNGCVLANSSTPPTVKTYPSRLACQQVCNKLFCEWTDSNGYSGNCVDGTNPSIDQGLECSQSAPCPSPSQNTWRCSGTADPNTYACKQDANDGCDKTKPTCVAYNCCDGSTTVTKYFAKGTTNPLCEVAPAKPSCGGQPSPVETRYYGPDSTNTKMCVSVVSNGDAPPGMHADISIGCKTATANLWQAVLSGDKINSSVTLSSSNDYCVTTLPGLESSVVKGSPTAHWNQFDDWQCDLVKPELHSGWCFVKPTTPQANACLYNKSPDLGTCAGSAVFQQLVPNCSDGTLPAGGPTACGTANCPFGYIPDPKTTGWGQCLLTFPNCSCATAGTTGSSSCPDGYEVGGVCYSKCDDIGVTCDHLACKTCLWVDDVLKNPAINDASVCGDWPTGTSCKCRPVSSNACSGSLSRSVFIDKSTNGSCLTKNCQGCVLETVQPGATPQCTQPPYGVGGALLDTAHCNYNFNTDATYNFMVCPDGTDCYVGDDMSQTDTAKDCKNFSNCYSKSLGVCVRDMKTPCQSADKVFGKYNEKSWCRFYNSYDISGDNHQANIDLEDVCNANETPISCNYDNSVMDFLNA